MFLCPIGGILSGKIGRKSTLLVTTPLIIVGFIILALARSTALIFIGWMMCTMSVNLNFSSAGNFHYHRITMTNTLSKNTFSSTAGAGRAQTNFFNKKVPTSYRMPNSMQNAPKHTPTLHLL